MSACNYTEKISPSECIGDSLIKINENFQNLDFGLCEKPSPSPGHATSISLEQAELGDTFYKTHARNSFVYNTKFDSFVGSAGETTITLNDNTPLKVTEFPYESSTATIKPTVSFTATSLTNKPPVMSLYWVASGDGLPLTTFDLNSATSVDKGQTWFDDAVTSLLDDGTHMYVGGKFTTVGGNLAEKVARINTSSSVGTFDSTNPITNLGSFGEIRQIVKATVTISGAPRKFLIFGGTFENIGVRGRGLLVYNQTDNIFSHFYVHGEVNALAVRDNILWVGGRFEYVNTGTSSAGVYSGRRVYTNGLFTVALDGLFLGLTTAALTDRSKHFEPKATINSIQYYSPDSLFYVGGDFRINESPGKIKCQSVCCLFSNGNLYETWRPIINGPVNKLYIDDTTAGGNSVYLYIAGNFSGVHSQTQFYLHPRVKDDFTTKFYNAVAVKLTNLTALVTTPTVVSDWKPRFNGSISSFLAHDNSPNTHLYCYGKYNAVNDKQTNFLSAITKASAFVKGELLTDWIPSIQNSPEILSNALLRGSNGLVVGGNFTEVNNEPRYNLAEVGDTTYAAPSLSSFAWDFGAHVNPIGSSLSLSATTTYTQRVSAFPNTFDDINVTSFTVPNNTFAGLHQGELLRFFVRRPGNSSAIGALSATDDSFKETVHVVGYKLDFN
jgi:hypothetical protein